jgi:hypothetical protein
MTVERAQRALESAMRRAAQSDDRELAGRVRSEGHRLVFLLSGLLRSTHLYADGSTALSASAAEVAAVLRGLLDLLGSVHIACVEDQVYVNDVRLRIRPNEQAVVDHFAAELGRHGAGGLSLHTPLDAEGVLLLAKAVAAPEQPARARPALAERLLLLRGVEVAGHFRFRMGGESGTEPPGLAQALRRSAEAVREAMSGLAAGRTPNPLPIRRTVMDLLAAVRADHTAAPAAVPLVRPEGVTPAEHHLVSVAVLSLLLGRAAGISDAALSDLGVAAMLHDAGFADDGPSAEHALAGARLLMRQRGFHEAKVRRLLCTLDHHLPYRGAPGSPRPSLFARIVHLTDDYAVLVGRPPAGAGLSPAIALARMSGASAVSYDPDLFALFVQVLGPMPPGTLLELSDGRWAVSVSGARDRPRFAKPLVRVVREADGTPDAGLRELDLGLTLATVRPVKALSAAALSEAWGVMSPAQVLERTFPEAAGRAGD